jgi:hypothetical protein
VANQDATQRVRVASHPNSERTKWPLLRHAPYEDTQTWKLPPTRMSSSSPWRAVTLMTSPIGFVRRQCPIAVAYTGVSIGLHVGHRYLRTRLCKRSSADTGSHTPAFLERIVAKPGSQMKLAWLSLKGEAARRSVCKNLSLMSQLRPHEYRHGHNTSWPQHVPAPYRTGPRERLCRPKLVHILCKAPPPGSCRH